MRAIHTSARASRPESQPLNYPVQMQPTMTTADWLRRAADAWSAADTTVDPEARRARILVAEGCERLAKHAAFLADGDAYPPLGRYSVQQDDAFHEQRVSGYRP
jgi:hypothetical protein